MASFEKFKLLENRFQSLSTMFSGKLLAKNSMFS